MSQRKTRQHHLLPASHPRAPTTATTAMLPLGAMLLAGSLSALAQTAAPLQLQLRQALVTTISVEGQIREQLLPAPVTS